MSANLENSAVATGLEKVSFHSNHKEGECQRMLKLPIQLDSFHMLVQLCSKSFKLGFSIVNEAEVDVFLEFPCFFNDLMDVSNLISGYSTFSKPRLYIWKFLVHILWMYGLNILLHCPSLGLE